MNFVFEQKEESLEYWPRGYLGVDKIGRPVYIERIGGIKVHDVLKVFEEETLWKYYYQDFERLIKWRFMSCSFVDQDVIGRLTNLTTSLCFLQAFKDQIMQLLKPTTILVRFYLGKTYWLLLSKHRRSKGTYKEEVQTYSLFTTITIKLIKYILESTIKRSLT